MHGSPSLCILGAFAHAASASASVLISNGTVHGVISNGSGVEKFLGIPYAEPPVGSRRLCQSVPLRELFGTLEANEFGPSCISARDEEPESEDCLTLNIWRPSNVAKINASLPVLVWLYGGSLNSGSTVSLRAADSAIAKVSHTTRPILNMKPRP